MKTITITNYPICTCYYISFFVYCIIYFLVDFGALDDDDPGRGRRGKSGAEVNPGTPFNPIFPKVLMGNGGIFDNPRDKAYS